MTKIEQDKSVRPAAVELPEDALDKAAGGGETLVGIDFRPRGADSFYGTGVYKSVDSGKT